MALITCKECDNQVSNMATACPRCGYPLNIISEEKSPAFSPDSYVKMPKEPKTGKINTWSLVGVIMSICSFFLINLWGFIGVIGAIVSIVGLAQCGVSKERGAAAGICGALLGVASTLYYVYQVQSLVLSLL